MMIANRASTLMCQFSSVDIGSYSTSTNYIQVPLTNIDDSHVSCVSPDWSMYFQQELSNSTFMETYLQITEFDGTFRSVSELRFRYYLRPVIDQLEPNEGRTTRVT
jgi:hypothetical protein